MRGRDPIGDRDEDAITDISERVYRLTLGPRGVASMIQKDKDEGQKLRRRAKAMNSQTVKYLTALNLPIPRKTVTQANAILIGLPSWDFDQACDEVDFERPGLFGGLD